MKETEDQLLQKCEEWLGWERIEYTRIPDSLFRFLFGDKLSYYLSRNTLLYNLLQGVRKQISKYLLGFPDIVIFSMDGRYLACELKTKTGKVRQGQKNKAKKMKIHVIRDFQDFRVLVNNFFKN
jgi:hypothetical protein